MRRECRERLPRHRLQRKPLVSDRGMHHRTCITHVPRGMSGSLTRGGGENIPGIPGACAIRNFTYLARGPFSDNQYRANGYETYVLELNLSNTISNYMAIQQFAESTQCRNCTKLYDKNSASMYVDISFVSQSLSCVCQYFIDIFQLQMIFSDLTVLRQRD